MPENKPQWTPGPWRVGIAWPTLFDVVADVPPHCTVSGSQTVLSAHADIEEGPLAARANIQLASAAPDLYEALEMLLPDAEAYWHQTLAGSPAAIQMARDALLKANPQREQK